MKQFHLSAGSCTTDRIRLPAIFLALGSILPAFALERLTIPEGQSPEAEVRVLVDALPWAEILAVRNLSTGVAITVLPVFTPAQLMLTPGEYELHLRNDRFDVDTSARFSIRPGTPARIQLNMGDFQPEDGLEAFGIQALLAHSEGVEETAWDSYTKALTAFQERSWEQAIALFRKAIEAQPVPRSSPRYTPYFYLGRAYDWKEQGDEALRYFERSASYGAIRKYPEDLARMQEWELRIKMDRPFEIVEVKKSDRPSAKAASVPKRGDRPPPETGEPSGGVTPGQGSLQGAVDLDAAILQFFRGEYMEAASAAEEYLNHSPEQPGMARFLAGAALYSRYLLFGANDLELRDRAIEYFTGVGEFRPPEKYLSPIVLTAYREVQP